MENQSSSEISQKRRRSLRSSTSSSTSVYYTNDSIDVSNDNDVYQDTPRQNSNDLIDNVFEKFVPKDDNVQFCKYQLLSLEKIHYFPWNKTFGKNYTYNTETTEFPYREINPNPEDSFSSHSHLENDSTPTNSPSPTFLSFSEPSPTLSSSISSPSSISTTSSTSSLSTSSSPSPFTTDQMNNSNSPSLKQENVEQKSFSFLPPQEEGEEEEGENECEEEIREEEKNDEKEEHIERQIENEKKIIEEKEVREEKLDEEEEEEDDDDENKRENVESPPYSPNYSSYEVPSISSIIMSDSNNNPLTQVESIELNGLKRFVSIIQKKKKLISSSFLKNVETEQTQNAIKSQYQTLRDLTDQEGFYSDKHKFTEGTWINCDLRYFSLPSLGLFDVVLIDPPWRIKGGSLQDGDEHTMFSNSSFSLDYNTLTNEEILDIDVGCLSNRGFCFLWVINSQLQIGFECLNKWGYVFADKITWVKKTKNNKIAISQGYYFLHSTETCLIGVKLNGTEYVSKVSNDLIISILREKSRKPTEIYRIIEGMMPGSRKIELFGRNHCIRPGWLTLGNELGEYYDWDRDLISCNSCSQIIQLNTPRYKHKYQANKDLCSTCFETMFPLPHPTTPTSSPSSLRPQKSNKDKRENFFRLDNNVDLMVFHHYFKCNGCQTEPIWGIRFHCLDCPDFDLCEECYDKKVQPKDSSHKKNHHFFPKEYPERAGGLPVHRTRCCGCQTYPIVGYKFYCVQCSPPFNLCQKCFFLKKENRTHRSDHTMDIITHPEEETVHDYVKCDACGIKPIKGARYKCTSCFNLDICEKCYHNKTPLPKHIVSHKTFHKFLKISH